MASLENEKNKFEINQNDSDFTKRGIATIIQHISGKLSMNAIKGIK